MRFSLIVPLAPDRDAPILESIKKLDYPRNEFHVVVVRGLNPSENRNKGAEKAKGEILVFLDDDALMKEDYLKKADEFLKKYNWIDVVGGPQLSPFEEKGFAKISGYGLMSKFGAYTVSHRYSSRKENFNADESMLTSANLICRKEVFNTIKFDTKLFPGEDPKFIDDARKAGFKVAYNPEIIVYHKRRPTIKLFAKQMFNYGKTRPFKEGFLETLKKPYFLVPSLFLVYVVAFLGIIISNLTITGNAIATGYWLFAKIPFFNFMYLLPATAYAILAFLFSVHDAAKNHDFKAVLLLPFIYFLIHISYGAGMIYGFFKKSLTDKSVG